MNMLRTELQNTHWAKRGTRLHILVDPSLGDPFQDLSSRKVPLPIVHAGLRSAQRPYLIQSRLQGEPFDPSVELAAREAERLRDDVPGARALCGWLFTSESTDKLASHLARQALLPTPDGERLLRYWDPRVMDLMSSMLSAEQARELPGPLHAWYWLARDASLSALNEPSQIRCQQTQWALRLSDEQTHILQLAPDVNRTLDILQDAGHDMREVAPLQLARCILQGRSTWGLSTEQEHVAYALHCVLAHEYFDQIPEVHEAMTTQVRKGHSAIKALDQFNDAYWKNVADSQGRTVKS